MIAVDDTDRAIAVAETELAELDARRTAVAERLSLLKRRPTNTRAAVTAARVEPRDAWSATTKVELFQSLFRGRDDVYAERWERPAKRTAGYSPSCANEWRPGVCDKPRVRCGACSH